MAAIELLSYQKKCFLDRSRFKILMWARGARKTFTSTLDIIDSIYESEARGRRCEWIIVSRGERQALEALKEGKRHCQAYRMAASDIVETNVYSKQAERLIKVTEIMFPMGSRVRALPALPDVIRGYSSNVYLDEFDIHPDATEVWRAAYPVLRGKYRMIVSSSPKHKGSKFHQLITGDDTLWSRHIVDIYAAVEQGLPFDIDYERTALGDEDAWAQEYELQWLDEASAWLSYELIGSCEDDDAGHAELYQGNPCYLGIDIARKHDLWAAWVLEPIGDVLWCRELVELRRASFAEQDAVIDRLMNQYRVVRAAIDQTGMGEKVVEDCQRKYGERVEGVMFSAPKKLNLATIGKQKFEARSIRIPNREEVRQDLHSLKRSTTVLGHVRFDADRENGSHADRAWALFLALYAAGDGFVDWSGFETIANSGSTDDFRAGLSDFNGW